MTISGAFYLEISTDVQEGVVGHTQHYMSDGWGRNLYHNLDAGLYWEHTGETLFFKVLILLIRA